jgi:integrase
MIEQYKKKRRDHIKTMPKNRGKADRDISFTTINRELALIEWGKIEYNPVKRIRMFPEKERERYITEEEIAALLEACDEAGDEVLKMMVVFALNTGARLGEILNLKVSNLDFKNRLITFVHTKCEEKGRVPMNECLRTFLKEHLKDHKYEYVICKANGEPYSKSRIGRRFRKITDIAGIKDFRFHDLRHTFASHLVMQGVDLITLQKLGRWKSYEMVLRYAHLSASHKKKAVDTLNGLFEGKSKACSKVSHIR